MEGFGSRCYSETGDNRVKLSSQLAVLSAVQILAGRKDSNWLANLTRVSGYNTNCGKFCSETSKICANTETSILLLSCNTTLYTVHVNTSL